MSQADLLVIGASGFLGRHIFKRAQNLGLSIKGTFYQSSNLRNESLLVPMDVTQQDQVYSVIQNVKPRWIINCAAYGVNPREDKLERAMRINFDGTSCILTAARAENIEKYIHMGSCFEYGQQKRDLFKETDRLVPSANYGVSKASASLLVEKVGLNKELFTAVFRVFGLWGEYEPEFRIVPQVLRAIKYKKSLALTLGEQVRDYSYAGDVADWSLALLKSNNLKSGDIVNVASGQAITIKDFVKKVASFFGQPDLFNFGELPYRSNEMMRLVADTSKLRTLIGDYSTSDMKEGLYPMWEQI